MELAGATWPQVEATEGRNVLAVPVGSLEQHGPHLPLDTDTRIALAVASGAARGRDGVAVSPPVAFGSSGEHAGFPGTLSIGSAALTALLVELGRDAARDWETMLLALRPAHVDMAAAVPGDRRSLAELWPVLRERGVRAVTATGVLGDPTGADANEGVAMLESLAAELVSTVRNWLA